MNRQVPKRYCIIGDGKVARHMAHYFDLLGISYNRWFRTNKRSPLQKLKQLFQSENASLKQAITGCEHVLILISDDQIEPFIQSNSVLKKYDLIHFSGALNTPLASACHPLMTFNNERYDLRSYQKIPFVHQPGFNFKTTFPQLLNTFHILEVDDQSKYHAFCVMAGNFSQMMWRILGQEMSALGLPEDVLHGYLAQNTINYINSPETAATGPFQRGDIKTIEKHLSALQSLPKGDLKNIYQAYLDWQIKPTTDTQHKVAS